MKKYFILFYFILFYRCVYAQNLVPNPRFENYDTCPSNASEISRALPWMASASSPDYFNSCAPDGNSVSVPRNEPGFQYPRTGNGYAGLVTFTGTIPNHREFMQAKLNDSLKPGSEYCVEFYICLAENGMYANDVIGAYFSKGMVSPVAGVYQPQIYSPKTFINIDTLNWVKVSGAFTATGGENYISIGNFFDDLNTKRTVVNNTAFYVVAYYYIDDVSVYEKQNADAGSDKVLCAGDSVTLGTMQGYGMKYTWFPATGLNDSTAAQPLSSPSVTTTYILTITDTIGANCVGKGSDTVTVYVNDLPEADAGTDTLLCERKSIVLGKPAQPDYLYQWSPSLGLNNTIIAQPTATPLQHTIYVLTTTDTTTGCINADTIIVGVNTCDIIIPSIIGYGQRFEIINLPGKSRLKIYNTLGQIIFQSENYNHEFAEWMVSVGVYYYELAIPDVEKKIGKFFILK